MVNGEGEIEEVTSEDKAEVERITGYFIFLEYYDYRNRDTHGESIPRWKLGGYITVENGGGGPLKANKYRAENWETFGINVISGGPLVHGAEINFRSNGDPPTGKPGYWIGTESAAEGTILVAKDSMEPFTIFKKNGRAGDQINRGDVIKLSVGGKRVVRSSENGPLTAISQGEGSDWQLTFHP